MATTDAHPSIHAIASEAALEDAIARSEEQPVVLYKHSLTCGLSFRARRHIEALGDPGDPAVYEIVVQQARPVAEVVATRFGIRHESPQVILLHQGRPIFDTSHWRITASAIRNALPKPPSA